MNVEEIRKDFPLLSRPGLIYLDNAATTQKPGAVIDALRSYYENSNANIHRGIYALAEEATRLYEESRRAVAEFIGCRDRSEIVFTRNATESVNLVAHSWGRKFLKPGDEILLTEMEHHSNIVPWQLCAKATGAALRYLPIRPDGTLEPFEIGPKVKLVAIVHMSNVLGTINPVEEIAGRARAAGAKILVDGAQSVPHMPVDVSRLGADFLVFSAHKMLGPTGVGVLWARRDLLEQMDPFLGGGDMISEVRKESSSWNELPYKFEAGTPNIGGVVAFKAAVDYLRRVGMENVREHEKRLTRAALEILMADGRAQIYGPPDPERRGGAVSFNLGQIHPHDVATILDQEGICTRAGHHCCQVLMRRLGLWGTSRMSFYIYNTIEEIHALVRGFDRVEKVFGPIPRTGCRELPKLKPLTHRYESA
jgi:cysteine desulfurase/selenocysteine lyase